MHDPQLSMVCSPVMPVNETVCERPFGNPLLRFVVLLVRDRSRL